MSVVARQPTRDEDGGEHSLVTFKCEACDARATLDSTLPLSEQHPFHDWIVVIGGGVSSEHTSGHLCSVACLKAWAGSL